MKRLILCIYYFIYPYFSLTGCSRFVRRSYCILFFESDISMSKTVYQTIVFGLEINVTSLDVAKGFSYPFLCQEFDENRLC